MAHKIADFYDDLEEDIIRLREEFQYGAKTILDDTKIKELVNDSKEFVEIVRVFLKK
ncbi:hypothetical protein ISS05_03200 [Candidatus Woesearchaeota archaeon]|nr:hypothetical protein [Candidatus Woesearchaeota archaeon]